MGIVLLVELIYAALSGAQGFALGRVRSGGGRREYAGCGAGALSDYMLPVEIASLLLLVAMVGAVIMAKRKLE